MPDPHELFAVADRIPVDDVWPDIRARLDPDVARRVVPLRTVWSPRGVHGAGWRRALTIAVAFALAVGAVVAAIEAFRPAPEEPGVTRIPLAGDSLRIDRVVVGDGYVWVLGTSGVEKVDPATDEVVATFDAPGRSDILVGEGSLWVSSPTHVFRLDPDTGEILATVAVDSGPMTLGAGSLWVGQITPDERGGVVRIDLATNEIAATIPISNPAPEYLVFTGGALWVEGTVPGVATVERVDPATNATRVVFEGAPSSRFGLSSVTVTADAVWAVG